MKTTAKLKVKKLESVEDLEISSPGTLIETLGSVDPFVYAGIDNDTFIFFYVISNQYLNRDIGEMRVNKKDAEIVRGKFHTRKYKVIFHTKNVRCCIERPKEEYFSYEGQTPIAFGETAKENYDKGNKLIEMVGLV